ncbi:MAG: phage exclusion protein Lit family protein, partial [Candidatus Contendobacter sp.]
MSPIRVLDRDLINSVARIAPEKLNALESFHIEHNPCAVFTNDQKFSFSVNTESKEIKLPTAALEYLWCACYAFYVTYQEYSAANARSSSDFDINGNQRIREALSLYQWGREQLQQAAPREWPSDKAKPDISATAIEDVRVANELYLCAAAWIMHHEFAHIFHNHKNTPINNNESRVQEAEADKSATAWILDGVCDEAELKKRGLGHPITHNLSVTGIHGTAGLQREGKRSDLLHAFPDGFGTGVTVV